jgi:hypothetical protein
MLIYDKKPKYLAEGGPAEQLFGHMLKKLQRYILSFVPAIFPGIASTHIVTGIARAEAEPNSGFPFVLLPPIFFN